MTARWANVALVSYPVADAVLTPRLPPGLALDRWQGRVFVSLESVPEHVALAEGSAVAVYPGEPLGARPT